MLKKKNKNSEEMKSFKVGTFLGGQRDKVAVFCYTRWYNKSWKGCIEYGVAARNRKEACALATKLRLNHEAMISGMMKKDPYSKGSMK